MATKKKNTTAKKNTAKKKGVAKKTNENSIFTSSVFIHGIVWFVLLAATVLFMYIDTKSVLSDAVIYLFCGLFGIMAYTLPVIFAGTLVYLLYIKSAKKLWERFLLSIIAMIDLGAIVGLFAGYDHTRAFEICGRSGSGGGLCGVYIAEYSSKFIGTVGSLIFFIIFFIVLACLISSFNAVPYIIICIKRMRGISVEIGDKMQDKREKHQEHLRERIEYEDKLYRERASRTSEEKSKSGLEYIKPDDDELPESLSKRLAKRTKSDTPKTISIAKDFATDVGEAIETVPDVFDDPVSTEELMDMRFDGEDEPAPEKEEQPPREKNLTETEKTEYKTELDKAASNEIVRYEFPTLNLLDTPKKISNDKRQELRLKAEQLIAVLDNFGVKAKLIHVTQGPTVTRFEIQPSSGTKLSKIVGLSDDIALNLAVSTVLIAPVPGKAATVGVEIPNIKVTPVTIREMLESPEFSASKSKLTVCLGKDIGGNVVVGDIAKWPHALIAGATGSGKSVCINTIVTSILYKADPNDVKLIMVDPKQVELGIYNGIPHLLIPVVTEAKKAAGALNWAVQEMMRRYDMFKNSGVRKIEKYNELMTKTGGEKIPQIVIIIDELADLMMVAAKEVEDYICRLAQLARAAGIHLVIATQRPSVDVITGLIKANVPTRIAFFVSSQVDSRTILDKAGAEKLLGMGDMLYFPAGARSTTRVQGAFVSDSEVERIINFISETTPETHYSEDLAEHIERVQLGENGVTPDKDDDGDPLLNDAIRLAVELGKISTSMVQRRLSVGYSRAGRIIDQMEARGIVSPANGSKPRDVLISHADTTYDIDDGETNDFADDDQ